MQSVLSVGLGRAERTQVPSERLLGEDWDVVRSCMESTGS